MLYICLIRINEVTWFKKSGTLFGQYFSSSFSSFLFEVWIGPSSVHKFTREENQLSCSYVGNCFIFYSKGAHNFWMFSVSTGSVNGRECQIRIQKDLHREDCNADTGDPIAGNYKSRKETLHRHDKLKISGSRYLYRFPFKNRKNVQLYNISVTFWSNLFVKKIPLSYRARGPFFESPGNFSGP